MRRYRKGASLAMARIRRSAVSTAAGLHTGTMARIRQLRRDSAVGARPHPTEVDCGWFTLTGADGETLLQVSTYGSDNRKSQPKVSQTLQIDAEIARQLQRVLAETFAL